MPATHINVFKVAKDPTIRKTAVQETKIRSNKKLKERNRAIVIAAKDVPCMDCGGIFLSCQMDFDHVRGDKVCHIAKLACKASEARLRAEIDKCDVVCANCHRLRTWKRANP